MQEALLGPIQGLRELLPEVRKDGTRRAVQLTRREEMIIELMEIVLRHVVIRDGNLTPSFTICRGCGHDRSGKCPVGQAAHILRDMGRPIVF